MMDQEDAPSRTAAVIGSGLIGSCWASLFARAGWKVNLCDVSQDQVDLAKQRIKQTLRELSDNGLLRDQAVDDVFSRVSFTTSHEGAVRDAVYVQECVPESVSLKSQIFKQLDTLVSDSCVLASSTSCIAPSAFTKELSHRKNCIVCHPVNPPHYIPVVEVVPAPWTSEETVAQARRIQLELGQAPVVLKKEVNGFIINRLQYALLMEAWRLVEDGVASPADIDTAVSCGLGLRWSFMGPFQTIDLNAPEGVEDYMDRYGETITSVCREQTDPREMKGTKTAKKIHDAMREEVPASDLKSGARREWRDKRLAALAVHKFQQDLRDEKEAAPKATSPEE